MSNATETRPSVFSPLVKALLDSFQEGVVVFDADGDLLYANEPARTLLDDIDPPDVRAQTLMPQLARHGGVVKPIRVDAMALGEAVFLPPTLQPESGSLARREQEAIVVTLDRTGWRLAETARELGISRTTLWRRLKAYGLHRDGRGRWTDEA